MRSVKGFEITMVTIISLVFALVTAIFFYAYFFLPFFEGPMKGIEASQYCTIEKEVKASWSKSLTVKFDKAYNAKQLLIYVTPAGLIFPPINIYPDKVWMYVNTGTERIGIGKLANLKEQHMSKEIPCMGLRTSLWKDQDQCHAYEGLVRSVTAEADQGVSCVASAAAVCLTPIGWIWCAIDFFSDFEITTVCNIDRLRVKLYYPCNYESTLVYGNCSSGPGVGWNHVYPLHDCAAYSQITPCSMENGEYYDQNIVVERQMPFPGLPLVKLGARAGCAGVQTGCNIDFYFGKPSPGFGCTGGVGWTHVATLDHLDYEYIYYPTPLSVSDYVELDESSTYHMKWCLRVESTNGCSINSIDVQRYVK